MMWRIRRFFKVIKTAVTSWQKDRVERLAAALSFYAIFSIAPSLFIVIHMLGLVLEQGRVETEIVAQIQDLMGNDAANIVQEILQARMFNIEGSNNLVTAGISIGTILFGASNAFVQLQGALNTIWRVRAKPKRGIINFLRTRLFSFIILLMIGFMLLFFLVLNTWLVVINVWFTHLIPTPYILYSLSNGILSFGITILLFALLYKIMPDVSIRWHDIWVGASVAAILFTLGKWAIGLYVGNSRIVTTFGASGALVVVLLWVYYSAQIVLFGAEFIKVFALARGRAVSPASHAIRIQLPSEDSVPTD